TIEDPYAFGPTIGDLDLHLIGEGRHEELYEKLGAHVIEHQGVRGTAFAVWAPAARAISVVGDFNSWDGRLHAMRSLGGGGVWEHNGGWGPDNVGGNRLLEHLGPAERAAAYALRKGFPHGEVLPGIAPPFSGSVG